jgi:hypothetical protein
MKKIRLNSLALQLQPPSLLFLDIDRQCFAE